MIPSNYIEFEPNRPETLVFGDAGPVALPGGEVAYTLADGRILRVAPSVAQSVAELKLSPGEQFRVCLHLGGPRDPYWSVWRPGSAKLAVVKRRRRASDPIPLNVAFREITRFVAAELKAAGEQWSDEARQDFVSTVIIQAQKQKLLGPWERDAA
jgi:hypothetical protein